MDLANGPTLQTLTGVGWRRGADGIWDPANLDIHPKPFTLTCVGWQWGGWKFGSGEAVLNAQPLTLTCVGRRDRLRVSRLTVRLWVDKGYEWMELIPGIV